MGTLSNFLVKYNLIFQLPLKERKKKIFQRAPIILHRRNLIYVCFIISILMLLVTSTTENIDEDYQKGEDLFNRMMKSCEKDPVAIKFY